MNYYVKAVPDSAIQGPFSAERIQELIATGALSMDSLVTSDIGESRSRVLKTPARDWIPARLICGQGSTQSLEEPDGEQTVTSRPSFFLTQVSVLRIFGLLALVFLALGLAMAFWFAGVLSGNKSGH